MDINLQRKIAFSMISGLGVIGAKKVLAYLGGLDNFFDASNKELLSIPNIGAGFISKMDREESLSLALDQIKHNEKNSIKTLFYLDDDYPQKLLQCIDAPIILYYKGNIDFNNSKFLGIVGTRNASEYGKSLCDKLIKDLAQRGHRVVIVSGLAYGIDIQAHKSALKYNIPTIAVLGSPIHSIYPSQHLFVANQMQTNGALVSEFMHTAVIHPRNFVKRNRIIAGMVDAIVTVESARKGGALITSEMANGYSRDVFAFPGRVGDKYSEGCNYLIKSHQALLIEGINDLEYNLGWNTNKQGVDAIQSSLFVNRTPEEETILDILKQEDKLPIDLICFKAKMKMNSVSSLLLKMEFEGIIKSLPGKIYLLKS